MYTSVPRAWPQALMVALKLTVVAKRCNRSSCRSCTAPEPRCFDDKVGGLNYHIEKTISNYMYIHICTHTFVCESYLHNMYIYIYICIHVHINDYICICIYICSTGLNCGIQMISQGQGESPHRRVAESQQAWELHMLSLGSLSLFLDMILTSCLKRISTKSNRCQPKVPRCTTIHEDWFGCRRQFEMKTVRDPERNVT